MHKYILFCLLFCWSTSKISAQKNYNALVVPVRIIYQQSAALNVGLAYGERKCGEGGFSYRTGLFNLEYSLDVNKPYLSPQLGWFGQFCFLETHLTLAGYYSKERDPDYRIIPELGFSPLGKIGITVGYGISLTSYTNDYIAPLRIGITYVLDEDPTRNI